MMPHSRNSALGLSGPSNGLYFRAGSEILDINIKWSGLIHGVEPNAMSGESMIVSHGWHMN